jgi:hypothetical protein
MLILLVKGGIMKVKLFLNIFFSIICILILISPPTLGNGTCENDEEIELYIWGGIGGHMKIVNNKNKTGLVHNSNMGEIQ